jgi:hypothetical protein
VEGYAVITSDGHKVGQVVAIEGEYLIVEHGHLRHSRNPLPKAFAHPNDANEEITMTMPKELLYDAPKVGSDGSFDRDEAAAHFGLAQTYAAAEGDTADPGVIDAERERLDVREHLQHAELGESEPPRVEPPRR